MTTFAKVSNFFWGGDNQNNCDNNGEQDHDQEGYCSQDANVIDLDDHNGNLVDPHLDSNDDNVIMTTFAKISSLFKGDNNQEERQEERQEKCLEQHEDINNNESGKEDHDHKDIKQDQNKNSDSIMMKFSKINSLFNSEEHHDEHYEQHHEEQRKDLNYDERGREDHDLKYIKQDLSKNSASIMMKISKINTFFRSEQHHEQDHEQHQEQHYEKQNEKHHKDHNTDQIVKEDHDHRNIHQDIDQHSDGIMMKFAKINTLFRGEEHHEEHQEEIHEDNHEFQKHDEHINQNHDYKDINQDMNKKGNNVMMTTFAKITTLIRSDVSHEDLQLHDDNDHDGDSKQYDDEN